MGISSNWACDLNLNNTTNRRRINNQVETILFLSFSFYILLAFNSTLNLSSNFGGFVVIHVGNNICQNALTLFHPGSLSLKYHKIFRGRPDILVLARQTQRPNQVACYIYCGTSVAPHVYPHITYCCDPLN